MASTNHYLLQLPAIVLSAEFLLGGIGRASPFPFRSLHQRICKKNESIAPVLFPVVPFKDVLRHNRWVGTWMIVTGFLLAYPKTRGSIPTLGCVLFWTGAGAYSQRKCNMPYWLPVVNATLGVIVWWIENHLCEKSEA